MMDEVLMYDLRVKPTSRTQDMATYIGVEIIKMQIPPLVSTFNYNPIFKG